MASRSSSAAAQAQPFDLSKQLDEDVLYRVERSMEVRLDRATVVYGTQGMTAGFRTDTGTWVRVQWRRPWKIYGPAWAGSECASVLRGVAKPDWFQTASWRDDAREVVWRADEMELVCSPVIDSTGVIATEPDLPESWWGTLKESLVALGEYQTERVGMRQDHLALRINQVFPDEVDTTVDEWVTAHVDLHWGNLTAPKCYLLDWEDWGVAPRGYDAAVLWGVSLQISGLADRVQHKFRTDLQTRSGKLAQLLFCTNVIRVNAKRNDPSPLVEYATRAADTLLAELRA